MQDLKDLKRFFLCERSRGTGPRATVCKAVSVREQVLPNYSLFKVRRTLMSIVPAACQVRKVL